MTNREWLATLTDEQLVKVMRVFREDWCSCCADNYSKGDKCGFCFDGQVEWLSQEHDTRAGKKGHIGIAYERTGK